MLVCCVERRSHCNQRKLATFSARLVSRIMKRRMCRRERGSLTVICVPVAETVLQIELAELDAKKTLLHLIRRRYGTNEQPVAVSVNVCKARGCGSWSLTPTGR